MQRLDRDHLLLFNWLWRCRIRFHSQSDLSWVTLRCLPVIGSGNKTKGRGDVCFHNLWPLNLPPVSTHYRRGLHEDEQVSWCWILVQGVSPGQTRPYTSTPHLWQASGHDGKSKHYTKLVDVLFYFFFCFISGLKSFIVIQMLKHPM